MATNLKNQIDAFRAVNTESSITPESLGVVLQSMADVITQNEDKADESSASILGLQQSSRRTLPISSRFKLGKSPSALRAM